MISLTIKINGAGISTRTEGVSKNQKFQTMKEIFTKCLMDCITDPLLYRGIILLVIAALIGKIRE